MFNIIANMHGSDISMFFDRCPSKTVFVPPFARFGMDFESMLGHFAPPFGSLLAISAAQ